MSADIKGSAQKVNSFIVALDKDITVEEATLLKELILRMRHVLNVTSHDVSISDYVSHQRIKEEYRAKFLDILL